MDLWLEFIVREDEYVSILTEWDSESEGKNDKYTVEYLS